jgi:geranylgeranyl diphosphate synthase type II
MKENDNRLTAYRNRVEEYLSQFYLRFHEEPQNTLFEAMEYSLLAGGKRLRSTLVFEFCRMFGGDWEKAIPLGAAIEMIHTYSLIHDDLPSMDNDDFRRGKPTNHKVFGEAMAILAGDALLTDAFTVAASADLPAEATLKALRLLSDCAGSLGMVGGQVLDIQAQDRLLTEQEVLNIQSRKTGALIRAACAMGAIAAGASEAEYNAVCRYAENLGLAFQIRDDMLDVIGSAEELGKGVGTDQEKNTFVRLYGLEECENRVNRYTGFAVAALDAFEANGYLAELAQELTGRKS